LLDNKDAQDLFFLLRHYHEAGNLDRLYAEALTLMEASGHDVEWAGAALLGSDARLTLEEDTRRATLEILADPVKRDRLVIHMDRSIGANDSIPLSWIRQFERGLGLSNV
jgi:predicted nucleotidyltransferase